MINRFFGDVKFNYGWETNLIIPFNRKDYSVTVSADAFSEKEEITKEQEDAFASFLRTKETILRSVEKKVMGLDNGVYIPALLKIKRDGEMAVIFDDERDVEGGIVVILNDSLEVCGVDQYL